MGLKTYVFDIEQLLKDAGLVAASGAAQVNSLPKIIDVGQARIEGVIVIDVSAVEIASNDELYRLILQGSNSATFASDIQNLAAIDFGATEVRDGGAIDSDVGRFELAFCNEADDIVYRYLRLYNKVSGAIATGINYAAFYAPVTWG